MSSSVKNLLVVLLSLTFVFAGYYLYIQNKSATLDVSSDSVTADMAIKAQVFVSRSQALDKIVLDKSIFTDEVFNAQKSYRTPIMEDNYGRTNPFSSTSRR